MAVLANRTTKKSSSRLVEYTVVAGGLGLLVFAIYLQIGGHRPIPFDDSLYLTSNAWVQRGLTWEGVIWAFTNVDAANWHPVTWISHMVDQQLFGELLGGHMIENVFWHWANSFLVYCLFLKLGFSRVISFSLALAFACHPLNVESVAWLSQRKNQISTYMLLGTILLYLDWRDTGRVLTLALLIVAYAVSLMAKAMGVSLPFILVVYEVVLFLRARTRLSWSKDRGALLSWLFTVGRRVMPLVVAAGVIAIATLFAQKLGGAVATLDNVPVALRLTNALAAIGTYVKTFFLPAELCFFYPISEVINWQGAALGLFILSALGLWVVSSHRRAPLMAFGFFWFLISLLPVIGLVQVGSQSHADRYMYVPMIGILIMLGAFFQAFPISRCRNSIAAYAAIMMAFALGMAAQSYYYVTFWRNPETAYRRSLEVGGTSFSMLVNLTATLINLNYFKTAEVYAEASVQLWPDRPMVVANLASLQALLGKFDEAEKGYRRAISMEPESVEHLYMLALVLLQAERNEEAELILQRALPLTPAADDWRVNRRMIRAVLLREIPISSLKLERMSESVTANPGIQSGAR